MSYDEEANEYLRHNNNMESVGYVKMFEDVIEEYIIPLNISKKVLDFGSGPGPVLYQLLMRKGYDTYHFDPFYHNDLSYQNNQYQLITSTEVVEHFYDPLKEFTHLSELLDEDGYLLIMTHIRNISLDEFLNWWYRRDPTHVVFYSIKSLEIIAESVGLKLVQHNNKNIILFQKK
jgi:2-polyprenyl-3-methyl-5-hydroxy-6-metoxy-1,4-benzoquinol methylase